MSTIYDLPTPWWPFGHPQQQPRFSGEWDAQGRRATMSFRFPWEQSARALQVIAGLPVSVGDGITRVLPLQYPYSPNMYASRFKYEGFGADKDTSLARPFPFVVVDVEFNTPPYAVDGDQPFLTVRTKASPNFCTVPGVKYHFSNGEKIDQDVGRMYGQKVIEVSKWQVPDLDDQVAVLDPRCGCVNSMPLTIGKTDYAAGTLLFQTYESDFERTVLGQTQYRLALSLIWRSLPWNQKLRSDGVVDTFLDPLGLPTYPATDLTPILG